MSRSDFFLYPLLFLYYSSPVASQARPRQIYFSTQSYGPDGPWQAVTVGVGTPAQFVPLYPGGFWSSNILNVSVCTNTTTTTCYGNPANLVNSTASNTFSQYAVTGGMVNFSASASNPGLVQAGVMGLGFDSLTLNDFPQPIQVIQSFDMYIVNEGYSVFPDGSKYPLEVGSLSLGAPDLNQTFVIGDGSRVNGTQLPNYLHSIGQIPSSSYGLHIGSATMGIPGSLFVGGYDQSRVMGPVSTQPYTNNWLPIDLLDIGIGVAEGQSPFSFGTKSGYLARNNATIGVALEVWVDPTIPYLYLPQSSCDSIAADLPVKFDSRLGLYLWQTDDPLYSKIVSSPSLLEFTFRLNSSTSQNMTINLPFSLLNLTLTAPYVDQPTPYFPCRPFYADTYYLGRAFLQGAFLGVNWMDSTNHNGVWWLAQAPGPNTPSVPAQVYIQDSDRNIAPSSGTWLDSWKDSWTPIGSTAGNTSGTSTGGTSGVTSTSSPLSSPPGTGLSTGAKAGIAAGIAVAAISIIAVIVFIIYKRTHKDPSSGMARKSGDRFSGQDDKGAAGFGPREMEGRETRDPLELDPRRVLNRISGRRYELGDTSRPAELHG